MSHRISVSRKDCVEVIYLTPIAYVSIANSCLPSNSSPDQCRLMHFSEKDLLERLYYDSPYPINLLKQDIRSSKVKNRVNILLWHIKYRFGWWQRLFSHPIG